MRISMIAYHPAAGALAATALTVLLCVAPLSAGPAGASKDPCEKAAGEALLACRKQATSDLWLQRAKCSNLPIFEDRVACTAAALAQYEEQVDLCWEQHSARLEVCAQLGGGYYAPQIRPEDFVPLIDNPYLPLLPGTTLIYEKHSDGELEHIEVSVTDETKQILGVSCTVVRDVVWVDGELAEDTHDWFAQDKWGNVWYFGELSQGFEDGELVSLGGSWQAGEDGALPGIVMEASPQWGDVYRQEFLLAEAEDVGAVLSLTQSVSVPYGSFTGCLQTEDYTPLEPDALEHKFYALGVGLVLELDVESGERTELIAILTD